MCGIFGIQYGDPLKIPDDEALKRSAYLLRHRGPDARGIWKEAGTAMVHTRLSLLDLNPRSNQPFWDPTGRYGLVFNGEIYNFRELRSELEEMGAVFHTNSDTEVLLHALIQYDAKTILPRLQGMFGFALFDRQEKTFLLARDRFGMKPLYFHHSDQCFAFASEVKAFRPWFTLLPEKFCISSYLMKFGGPTKGFTFYEGVMSLAPGTMLTYRKGVAPEISSFFAIPDFVDPGEIERLNSFTSVQMVDYVDELLFKSVEKHMFADSPVGAFCSGGVDSSVIMAMAAKIHGNLAIFHSNIKGPWSEYQAALALSRHLKLDLNVVEVDEQDFIDYMPDVMDHYEHPFTYHPNCVPLLLVARLVSEHGVKGMLSGEGADECFLGYPWLGRKRAVDAYYRYGNFLKRLVHKIPNVGKIIWPDTGQDLGVIKDLLNRREIADDERAARDMVATIPAGQAPTGLLWSLDYLNYHLRTLLHRNDSLGMAGSIEARFPFLDHDLVRAAVNMPYNCKLRFSPTVFEKAHPFIRDKWVIRKVADRYVPAELSQRIKIGFWTTAFQRTQVQKAYFKDSYVRDLLELSFNQMKDLLDEAGQDLTMRLLHLDVWGDVCLRDREYGLVQDKLRKYVSINPE